MHDVLIISQITRDNVSQMLDKYTLSSLTSLIYRADEVRLEMWGR